MEKSLSVKSVKFVVKILSKKEEDDRGWYSRSAGVLACEFQRRLAAWGCFCELLMLFIVAMQGSG